MVKKKAYSARKVQRVDVETMRAGREGQAAWVGVDVGKWRLLMVVRWADGTLERPIRVDNPSEVGEAIGFLHRLGQGRWLTVAMESSGTYGDVFRQAAGDEGLEVHRVGGKAAHDYAEVFDGVPSQHDGKDAAVIAELAAIGKSAVWPWSRGTADEQWLRVHVQALDAYEHQRMTWCNRVEAWLARHWPEVGGMLELGSATLLGMLAEYGSPAAVASDPGARSKLRSWGGALLSESKIAEVLASARTTIGVRTMEADRQEVRMYAAEALRAKRRVAEHRQKLSGLGRGREEIVALSEAVGMATACVLCVEGGDPGTYSSGRAYLKALGLNLTERTSGGPDPKRKGARATHEVPMHISKRGSARARRWLFYAALREIQKPGVRQWYARKVQRDGGLKLPGVVAVMRKLGVALHRIRTDEVRFDRRRLFREAAKGSGVTEARRPV